MKTIHNFNKSLLFERSKADFADNFYRTILNVTEIKRFNSDNEEDMFYQKQDIDVEVKLKEKVYRISEKFRDKDFGDLYIEVFSMYPEVAGWMKTGNPDAIMYFTPKNACWISHLSLKFFYENKLLPHLNMEWFQEIYQSGKTITDKMIEIEDATYKISLIQAHNHNKVEWKTLGVSVPYNLLEKSGVKYKMFEF